MKLMYLIPVVLVACTKPNPEVCCASTEDCASIGVSDETRDCATGLACESHECVVPTCSESGCSAAAPVCDLGAGVCGECSESSECSRFADAGVCDTSTGSCVECVMDSDCTPDQPVCDTGACRACRLDSECPSGACADDGTCVAETSIVYLDPAGADAGVCDRGAPCKAWRFAVSRTSATRVHIVMATGAYDDETSVTIGTANTQAAGLTIHGGGATITHMSSERFLGVGLPMTIRDLEIVSSGQAIGNSRKLQLEQVIIRSSIPIVASASLVLHDVLIESTSTGQAAISLFSGSNLELDRAVIHGGRNGLSDEGNLGVNVQISNLLVYGASEAAINFPNAAGALSFVTVAESGMNTSTGPRSVVCRATLTVRSSIIWDPGSTTSRPPIGGGCSLVSTIAGPAPVPGAMNVDPIFINPATHDFHIAPNSPARDVVDVGPASDFDGDPRPRGLRFDIGADEAP